MIKIGNREIGTGCGPFIIAEMSGNHNQSLARALEIVEAAAKAGAHGFKIQTYTPDTMTLDLNHGEYFINDPTVTIQQSVGRYISIQTLWSGIHSLNGTDPFSCGRVNWDHPTQQPYYRICIKHRNCCDGLS